MKKTLPLLIIFILLSLIFYPHFLLSLSSRAFADDMGQTKYQNTTVSAFVLPRIRDYQFNFVADGSPTLYPGETIWYQITYGSTLDAVDTPNTTITADWSNDTAPNGADVLRYYFGTATDAYGGIPPVIDLTNHTITWTIPNLPAKVKDQTVSFKLLTTSNYTGSDPITFRVRASLSNHYHSLPDQFMEKTYHYYQPPAPTAETTPTPTPRVSPIPTPTPALSFGINSIAITSLSDSGTTIQTITNEPTKLEIKYGTSPNTLPQSVGTTAYTTIHSLQLSGLEAKKTYYFKEIATNAGGESISSDIFTLQTAKQSVVPNVQNSIIVLSSNGNVFSSGTQQESDFENPSIILTNNTDDTIAYTLTNPIAVKKMDVVVTNKVLGANTFSSSNKPDEFIFPMQEKTPTLYVANLTKIPQGAYDVAVRITDLNGNILQKHVSDLKIMPKLIVYGADTHTPLSDARIYLLYYNKQTKSYQPVTSTLFGDIQNPSYTDVIGQSPITIPAGKYRIEESSLFYDPQVKDFTIGSGVDQNFPILYLKRDPLNIISLVTYTKDYLQDSWTKILTILGEFSSSVRIFHLVALEILTIFIGLTFFLFLFRSHISFKHLPNFVLFHLHFLIKQHTNRYIFGNITDKQNNPLTRVLIEIEDAKTRNILSDGSSHKSGKFYVANSFEQPINLLFFKEGFETTTITLANQNDIPESGLHITMLKGTPHNETIMSSFIQGLEEGFGMLFEAFLISSFLLEILFAFFLTKQITLPIFFILSVLNIILWIFYLRERTSRD